MHYYKAISTHNFKTVHDGTFVPEGRFSHRSKITNNEFFELNYSFTDFYAERDGIQSPGRNQHWPLERVVDSSLGLSLLYACSPLVRIRTIASIRV